MNLGYDETVDVLYVSIGKPRKALSDITKKGIIVRRHPKTKKIIGYTVLDFMKRVHGRKRIELPLINF